MASMDNPDGVIIRISAICESDLAAAKVAENFARTCAGLGMDGMSVSMDITPYQSLDEDDDSKIGKD